MLIASAPGILWLKRGARNGTRYGASVGPALVILVGTINTFLPGANMWVLSMPEVFDTPLFYLTGAIFVAISAFNLAMLLRLPAKEASEEIPRLSGESVPPDKCGGWLIESAPHTGFVIRQTRPAPRQSSRAREHRQNSAQRQ